MPASKRRQTQAIEDRQASTCIADGPKPEVRNDEPVRRFNITTGSSERIVDCRSPLQGGCAAVIPDGSVLLRLTRGDHDVFSLELQVR